MTKPRSADVPHDVLDAVTDPSSIYAYLWFQRRMNRETGFLPCSMAALANDMKCDINTLRRAFRILGDHGILELVGKPGKQRWRDPSIDAERAA